jgi:hypothetical protein
MSWKPTAENKRLLDYALAKIQSVPYKVNARWTFYQLVQAGLVEKKKGSTFEYLTSKARKMFYGGWYPSLLTDSVRKSHFKGERGSFFQYFEDSIREQDCYVQLWFEAEAMLGQFEFYTKDYRVSLVPFRGDCSIPIKWELAKKIEEISEEYELPIKILYFGDCDEKGLKIFQSALKDIKAWCNVDFSVERVGLTLEQAHALAIPDNPNSPGSYQWEALNDAQAGQLILDAVEKYVKKPSEALLKRESEIREECISILTNFLTEKKL